ncbi:Regulatory protein AfsR [Seiridium cupressi]
MRLLSRQEDGRASLTSEFINEAPLYAILSHTWGSDDHEVTFEDIATDTGREKKGYRKIDLCGRQAANDGLQHFWVDICCINKSNATELQEAITSMFRWYRDSARCYAYLSDVHHNHLDSTAWVSAFRRSRWFTRGWTLQELLAPPSVEFFHKDGKRLGDRKSLASLSYEITNVPMDALKGRPLHEFSVDERMLWATGRETKRKEDRPYSLFGIFGVSMFLNYGEGEDLAMSRLGKEIYPHPGTKDLDAHRIIPLGRNKGFVGREYILDKLMEMILPADDSQDCQRVAVEGLGGVGKTQIALEAAYRAHEKSAKCSIFWVPAVSRVSFENGYRDIGQALKLPGIDSENANVKTLVKAALTKISSSWLLIIDNADDTELLSGDFNSYALLDYLPFNTKGSILITTRNHEVTVGFDVPPSQTLVIDAMSEDEALRMLGNAVKPNQLRDIESTKALLDLLAYLPLAIKQASAYMSRTRISTKDCLASYRCSDQSRVDLLSRNFEDRGRYQEISNPIATTWLISFSHVERNYPLAAR